MVTITTANQLTTLDDTVKYAEIIEAALRDQTKLSNDNNGHHVDLAANISDENRNEQTHEVYSYRKPNPRNRNQSQKPKFSHHKPCSGCGSSDHGYPGSNNRTMKCPAWGKTCHQCGTKNHFASVCRHTSSSETVSNIELIAHIKYDPRMGTYKAIHTTNDIEIPAQVTFGHAKNAARQTVMLPVFPDSGASICLAGRKHLQLLGINIKELVPSTKHISVVGGTKLPCLGWTPVRFKIGNHYTKQPLFFCNNVERLFLSKQACMDTCVLSPSFPRHFPVISPSFPRHFPVISETYGSSCCISCYYDC